MSATTLFYLLIALIVGIWTVALMGFWYGRKILEHQRRFMGELLPYLKKIQAENETIRSLSIPDTTPLSKLQDMTLPDHIQIDFQHRRSEK